MLNIEKLKYRSSLLDVLGYICESFRKFVPCDRIQVALLENHCKAFNCGWARLELEDAKVTRGYASLTKAGPIAETLSSGTPCILDDLKAIQIARSTGSSAPDLVGENEIRPHLVHGLGRHAWHVDRVAHDTVEQVPGCW